MVRPEQGRKLVDNIQKVYDADFSVIVYNFLDILSHARTETDIIRELTEDDAAFRSLTRSWFEHNRRRKLLQVASHFTHAGVCAVVAVTGIAVELGIGLALLGHVVIDTAFAAQQVEEISRLALDLAKRRFVVVEKRLDGGFVQIHGVLQMQADRVVDGVAYRVAVVVFEVTFLLLGGMRLKEVGANQQRDRKEHQRDHHVGAAHHRHPTDQGCGRAGGKGGEEPAADHGEHAGNAVDGRFTVPGAVGKARTHGDHEGQPV